MAGQGELAEIQRRREQFENSAMEIEGTDVHLADSQLEEYGRLKAQAARDTSELQAQLDQAARALASAKDALQRCVKEDFVGPAEGRPIQWMTDYIYHGHF